LKDKIMSLRKYKKKIQKFTSKSLSNIYDKPLETPTEFEKDLIGEVKEKFKRIKALDTDNVADSEKSWLENVNRLVNLVSNQSPREFLRWKVISGTMNAKHGSYLEPEFTYLKNLSDWKSKWSEVIKENSCGHPIPFWRYPQSSGNLIHHAYHVALFEEKTGKQINEIDFVFEFGGGYGSMCRLFHNLGFNSKYIIFDLEAFCYLQEYFLKSIGLKVQSKEEFQQHENGITCFWDIDSLKEALGSHRNGSKSLFVATWSLSETPLELRKSFFPLLDNFANFLIAYQTDFFEVDNTKYFIEFRQGRRDIDWLDLKIEHIPSGRYLLGKPK